ncbi:MAG TPA: hypothetical protein DCR40_16275 [Prolixibacteraceae bacterium]|nr:hypothetical protein [Prolixibacteraceae bacterium]
MKIIAICVGLLIILGNNVRSQEFILKGRIRCINSTENSTKGAENIIVVPAFRPAIATITASQPSGYFEINTGVPLSKLQDKLVSIYVVSRCANCREITKRVFISEDQDRQNRNDTKQYVTIKDWMLNTNCQLAELKPFAADSVLNLVIKQPGQNLDNVSAATALTGAPVFLNFLTTITPVLGLLPNAGSFQLQTLEPGKMSYGQFLLSSPISHSANTGFNFSPSRDMSEAAFWNPSAIAFSKTPNNLSLLTNVKNNVKLGGFLKVNEKISISAGGIYTVQDERRKSVFKGLLPDNNPNNTMDVDSLKMKLKEYAAFISPVYKVSNQFSMGVTLKSVWQDFNIPYKVFIEDAGNGAIGTFTDSIIRNQHFDVDISATYKLSNSLQLGVNLMNLAGNELYADAFVPGQSQSYNSEIPMQNLRSLGLGLTYKWQRLNVGADVLFTQDEFYDAAIGVNYVPFNNALLSGGFAVKQMSYSLAFRIKNFRIAYINDNDWMVNERRTGKSAIFNGKIYGGFIFDLK